MYKVFTGNVQGYVANSNGDGIFQHFGKPEYDINKPVISDRIRKLAQGIVDQLNKKMISEDEAVKKLLDI
jgi:hypothetical protein